jgi:hypothetical protein
MDSTFSLSIHVALPTQHIGSILGQHPLLPTLLEKWVKEKAGWGMHRVDTKTLGIQTTKECVWFLFLRPFPLWIKSSKRNGFSSLHYLVGKASFVLAGSRRLGQDISMGGAFCDFRLCCSRKDKTTRLLVPRRISLLTPSHL